MANENGLWQTVRIEVVDEMSKKTFVIFIRSIVTKLHRRFAFV